MIIQPLCSLALPSLALDRRPETRREKQTFAKVRKAERHYSMKLRSIADQIDHIVRAFGADDLSAIHQISDTLRKYSEFIKPWAEAVGRSMVADVARRDEQVWTEITRHMGEALRNEIRRAPTGLAAAAKIAEQVDLITSLPVEAAERVQGIALKSLYTGARSSDMIADIMKTGDVSRSRAKMIARTEVGRASSALTEARATYIGSEGYIWRTAKDSDVRNKDGNPVGSHRLLEGKFIAWNQPPVASTDGSRAHAGAIYNCRCWMEVVLPRHIT